MTFRGIDLFSDTATKPTLAMKKVMMEAAVGDEQKGEDPTTQQLEKMVADLTGLSRALFFPSATMANEVAICCLSSPGSEIIAAENAHILTSECGAPAILAGVMCKAIPTQSGVFTEKDLNKIHWSKSVKRPPLSLISVENTTNMGGGIPWKKNELTEIVDWANEHSLKKHMDGARIFNARVKTKMSVKEICRDFDTVTICLSKGLGCPVGALLAFKDEYYEKIWRLKNLMGGAMRQTGILTAAGIYALNYHIERLEEDHQNAELLANKLSEFKQIHITTPPQTNMVFFEWKSDQLTPDEFYQLCLQKGLRFSQVDKNKFRAVTHLDISKDDINQTYSIVKEICSSH